MAINCPGKKGYAIQTMFLHTNSTISILLDLAQHLYRKFFYDSTSHHL